MNMSEKHLPLIGIVGLALLVAGYFFLVAPQDTTKKDLLTFSNTGTWDPEPLAYLKETTIYPSEMFSDISLPPPPKNTSPEAAADLATLHSYQDNRTAEQIADINNEINFSETVDFDGHTVSDYEDATQFPATARLLEDSYVHDLTVITMQQKAKFDRVRPNKLDPTITTVIPVPGHPAYPSGHSTQAHFVAYVLGELDPSKKSDFIAIADKIAKGREIAGLHYPSDTRAGVLLAQQIFDAFMKNEKFQTLLAAAKKEWLRKASRPLAPRQSKPA